MWTKLKLNRQQPRMPSAAATLPIETNKWSPKHSQNRCTMAIGSTQTSRDQGPQLSSEARRTICFTLSIAAHGNVARRDRKNRIRNFFRENYADRSLHSAPHGLRHSYAEMSRRDRRNDEVAGRSRDGLCADANRIAERVRLVISLPQSFLRGVANYLGRD